jgi:hypothetical protein
MKEKNTATGRGASATSRHFVAEATHNISRERHPRLSLRNAAASPLVPPCLTSTVALLPTALVILDPHVHALPYPRMRAPPFAGSRLIPAALISGEPLPCPIPARAALLGFVFHFFFWGSNFTSFSRVSVELPLFSYTDLESWRRSIRQAPGRGLARATGKDWAHLHICAACLPLLMVLILIYRFKLKDLVCS